MNKHTERPTTPAPARAEDATARKRNYVYIAAALALCVVLAVWWVINREASNSSTKRVTPIASVVAETTTTGDININLSALGTVTSLATVTIRSQISGYLRKINFKEGDEVNEGDILAEIDSRSYEAALAQAQGTLARDEALLKGAQVDLARYQTLSAQNAVPRQTLDTQTALVAQYQGTVEADRAAVKAADVNLQYTKIKSPIKGRVGLRQVDQGNYVTAGDAGGIVVITQLTPISVVFTLPEDNLQALMKRIRDGAKLMATAYDRASINKIAEGVLQSLDSQIDPTTGTIKIRAEFTNETQLLFPNQFVNIRLLLDTHKNVTTISTAGVQRGAPGTFVYLINGDDTVSVRPIKIGATDGERVEVLSGLNPGDRIVIDGADRLRDGARIVVRSPIDKNAPPEVKSGRRKDRAGKKTSPEAAPE